MELIPISVDSNKYKLSEILGNNGTDCIEIYQWRRSLITPTPMMTYSRLSPYRERKAGFRKKFDTVQESLIIESAYFIIGEGGVARAKELVDKGVRVRVLTNSLVSNDVLAAHASYRKQLLEAGAEVYELLAYMDEGILPENSYRLMLDEDGDLVSFILSQLPIVLHVLA